MFFIKLIQDKCFLVKVDREKQIIIIDEYLEEVSVEELQVNLIALGDSNISLMMINLKTGTTTVASAKVYCLQL